jgi:hypothetical protein
MLIDYFALQKPGIVFDTLIDHVKHPLLREKDVDEDPQTDRQHDSNV